jgi:hypothetical protein
MNLTSIATSAGASRRAYEPAETMISTNPGGDFELYLRESGAGDAVLLRHSHGGRDPDQATTRTSLRYFAA